MEIIKKTTTSQFKEELGGYRLQGSFTTEGGKAISLNANVSMVTTDEEGNEYEEELGYIALRKNAGKEVKTICEELTNGVLQLINALPNED